MTGSLNPLWLVVAAVIIAFIPILAGLVTSYIKVSVVLGLLRSGLGAQQVPGNVVIMALSLAITLFVMSPVMTQSGKLLEAYDFSALMKNPSFQALTDAAPVLEPWREFLEKHAGLREREMLLGLSQSEAQQEEPQKLKSSFKILIPAFVLSEIKQAFAMGFVLLLPFLVIDLIVANILAGMGMMMVSPLIISLPLKLVLFVVSDGWLLLTKGLINSYGG